MENDKQDSPDQKQSQFGWLVLFSLPSFIGSIITLSTPQDSSTGGIRIAPLWFILSGCYLFAMSLLYGRKKKRRGIELVGGSLAMALGLLAASFLFCLFVFFAGCVCGASQLSRINR